MIKKLATSITRYSIMHNWIDHSHYAWCQYALEKELGKILFFSICLLWMKFTHTWFETSSFIFVFYLFRSRMGGWHAHQVWSCQLISIVLVIIVTFGVGPFIISKYQYLLIPLNITIIAATFFVSPVYPVEAHFTQAVKVSNKSRKNIMLLILIVLQGATIIILGPAFLTYSLLALLITDISVLLQYFTLKQKD